MIPYIGLNKQFINGQCTDGRAEVTIDVDTAFQAVENSSAAWAATNSLFRRDLLLKAARLIFERQEEFIDWLTKETGSI